ncbi:MAG: hypothetical protein IJ529_02505 [Alphaproteobacteria bacterium]|nr:hypothetical protein [Alphaproteobacteria bacterium]MBR1649479.1 hypothetical protein [Alphaproteobacteria bacterium]
MRWIIIGFIVYFVLRFLLTPVDEYSESGTAPPKLDEEKFADSLKDKTECELWDLRNIYHDKLTKAFGTPEYGYFLDCIGVIDKKIYALRHS